MRRGARPLKNIAGIFCMIWIPAVFFSYGQGLKAFFFREKKRPENFSPVHFRASNIDLCFQRTGVSYLWPAALYASIPLPSSSIPLAISFAFRI